MRKAPWPQQPRATHHQKGGELDWGDPCGLGEELQAQVSGLQFEGTM